MASFHQTICAMTLVTLQLTLQASSVAADAPNPAPTGFPSGADEWIAPPGTAVSIDRKSGRTSIALPTQPIDGSSEQLARFAEWRSHPYPGNGPYPSTRSEPGNFPRHTLYYPASLANVPKLPVILWSNGGCRTTSVEFTRFLGEIASHGYFVAAVGRSDIPFEIVRIGAPVGAGEHSYDARPRQDMLSALDLLTQESSKRASPFYGKLDLNKVAAMGQSCGGFLAFQIAKDPRIKAVAALNSNFPTHSRAPLLRMPNADPQWTAESLRIPAAFFTGGPADLAYQYAVDSYDASPGTTPIIRVDMPSMGHTGAYPMPDVRWTGAVVSWLDWTLKGDIKARSNFVGAECGLCGNPDFWVSSKGS